MFLFIDIPMVTSIICYQCTDCPEPFIVNYPYVTLTNNTNFLAQCTVSDRTIKTKEKLISFAFELIENRE